jgi:hypothetical protein
MKLTNRLGLPRSIENAVRNDRYSRGDAHISVTGLIAPARKRALEAQHQDEITEDVSERIWSLMGQIAHGILERADDQAWCEERLFIERHGWRISGSFDRYVLEEDGRLQDYKLTSTYAIKEGAKPEWEAQENIYALMLREHGYKVTRLDVVAILRDWQKSKAKHTPDYPQVPALVIPVEMWPKERTETYIRDRLMAHGKAQHVLPQCTPDERWERGAIFVVTKEGNVRATSLHDTKAEAEAAAEILMANRSGKTAKANYTVSERPPEQKRCQDYCAALPFCEQGQALIKATEDFRLGQIWSLSGPRASAAA